MRTSVWKAILCGVAAAAMISGCSPKAAKNPAREGTETSASAEVTPSSEPNLAESAKQLEMKDLTGMDMGVITLGNYKGIEVTKEPVEVSDEEVAAKILSEREGKAVFEDVDRPVEDSDKVIIDYEGAKDGVAFEGGTGKAQELVIGSNQFIPGFESGLIGAKKGDEVTLNLTFPENYGNKELSGQAVVFKVTVNNVQKQTVPELNDEFVQSVSDSKTVPEYQEKTRQEILGQKEANAQATVENSILKAVISSSAIEPNQEAVDAYYNNYLVNYTNQAAMYGIDLNTYITAFTGMDENAFQDYVKSMSKAAVEQRLVFQWVAEKEGITITDEDREKLAKDMNYESKDKMIEAVGNYAVEDYLLAAKTMKFLVDQAVIK